MQVTFDLPEALAVALRINGRDPAGAALEAIALEAFRERRITAHQLQEFLGLTSGFDLDAFLKLRRIETYSAEDFEHDLAVIEPVVKRPATPAA